MGTEVIDNIGKSWLEIEADGPVKSLQNWSGYHLEVVFSDDPPGLTTQGIRIQPGDFRDTIGTGRVFVRADVGSPYSKATLAVVT